MKKTVINLLTILSLSLLTSCASYIARMHNQLDRDMNAQNPQQSRDQFAQYRGASQQQAQAAPQRQLNPVKQLSSSQVPNMAPAVPRQYRQSDPSSRRVTASDLNDNDNSGSLWVNNGNAQSLFLTSKEHNSGDIILVNVHSKLRNEMTLELQRAFPAPPKPKTADGANPPADPAANADDEEATDADKVYDRISTVIVEQINRDHVLLRGRKNLIFRNRKRLVEIQALVPRREIGENDIVHSDNIVELSINVLR